MRPNVGIAPEYELWVLLQQACDAMTRARDNELREFGISTMQAAVLLVVKAINGPATPAEISRWLFREPHTVSGLLQRMEKEGLVRKVKDLERRNIIRVAITEKGEEAYQRSRDKNVIHEILASLSQEQQDNLRPYLETLRDRAVEELRPRYCLPFP
jgi:DNA-binding MarR family transcriptional regulator